MKTKEIKAVLALLEGTDVTEFEYEDEAIRVAVRRGTPASAAVVAPALVHSAAVAPGGAPAATGAAAPVHSGHVVRSPFVGTFYKSPSPDSAPFTDVGQTVHKGQTLCIVEAMKLMNEIECDADGVVTKVLVENAATVEYDQALFVIEPA